MSGAAFFCALISAGILSGVPLLLAALGEIFAERSGVLNLGIDGMMLFSAMVGFGAALHTGSPWAGLAAAMLAGAALSGVHAIGVTVCKGDADVSGLALGIFGAGLSSVLGQELVGMACPSLPDIKIPGWAMVAAPWNELLKWNSIVFLTLILSLLAWLVLERSLFGLTSRAALCIHPFS